MARPNTEHRSLFVVRLRCKWLSVFGYAPTIPKPPRRYSRRSETLPRWIPPEIRHAVAGAGASVPSFRISGGVPFRNVSGLALPSTDVLHVSVLHVVRFDEAERRFWLKKNGMQSLARPHARFPRCCDHRGVYVIHCRPFGLLLKWERPFCFGLRNHMATAPRA